MLDAQGTPEWHAARLGKVTASKIADVMARTKNGWGAMRANYQAQLMCERLTGVPTETFTNAAMQWGTDFEAEARAAYSFRFDADVVETGFVPHPRIEMAGASPDGLVGDDGLVEIKCPTTATHLAFLLGGGVPDKYVKQMQFQMACTDRQWCDFVSYDPRLPERHRMFVQRFERDDEELKEIEAVVAEFLLEIATKIEALEAQAA